MRRYLTHADLGCRNTFSIPEVRSEPCLLLCPHVMLLSLAFADEAFAALDLTGPAELFELRVPPGLKQLEVPIKSSKMEMLLFRSLRASHHGKEVSDSATITDQWLRERTKHLGDVTGFKLPVGPYCFRRGNGEAIDSSSKSFAGLQ